MVNEKTIEKEYLYIWNHTELWNSVLSERYNIDTLVLLDMIEEVI